MPTPRDNYYKRSEISNSDLTALYYRLYPQLDFVKEEDKQRAFHLGTLVDALITEPDKVNHYRLTVDNEQYTKEEFEWGKKMHKALRQYARRDKFLDYVLKHAETQKVIVSPDQPFEFGCFKWQMPCRCKFDWFLGTVTGDLKTTSCETYNAVLQQYRDIWLRGRVFYMQLAHHVLGSQYGNKDFVFAISKQKQKVFYIKIERGDDLFNEGLQKLNEIAFKAWQLMA